MTTTIELTYDTEEIAIPCEICVLLAVCKQKQLPDLSNCSIFKKYLKRTWPPDFRGFRVSSRQKLEKLMKPTGWRVDKDGCLTTEPEGTEWVKVKVS
jgi:hypothetical protein